MVQALCVTLLVLVVTASAAAQPSRRGADAPDELRYSGSIVTVAPDGSSIVIGELGPWTGPDSGLVTRSVHIAPHASIRRLEFTGRWDDRSPTPGWDSTEVEATSLRPGDFVTVTAHRRDRGEAIELQVVRPQP